MSRGWAALALTVSVAASAHDADVIYVLAESLGPGSLREQVSLTAGSLAQLAPVDSDGNAELTQSELDAASDAIRLGVWAQMPLGVAGSEAGCERSNERAELRDGFIALSAEFACQPGELRQRFRYLSILPANYRVVLGSQFDSGRNQAFAQGTLDVLTVTPSLAGSSGPVFSASVAEGFARLFVLPVLASLVLVLFVSASAWPRASLCWALGSAGALWSPSFVVAPAVLVAAAVATVAGHKKRWVVGLAALAAFAASAGASPGIGRWVGFALASVLVGAPAVLIGRMLLRRPRAQRIVVLALLAGVCFGGAFAWFGPSP